MAETITCDDFKANVPRLQKWNALIKDLDNSLNTNIPEIGPGRTKKLVEDIDTYKFSDLLKKNIEFSDEDAILLNAHKNNCEKCRKFYNEHIQSLA